MVRSKRGAKRRGTTLAVLVAMATIAAGCGSSDDGDAAADSTAAAAEADDATETTAAAAEAEESTDEEAEEADAPAADGILAEAQRISALAVEGLVWAAGDSDVAPADIVAQTEWLGPDSSPAPTAGANMQVIICAPGTACEAAAVFAVEAAEAIGWTAEIVPGAGTPESFTQAFDTALSKNPDVIMTMAIPDVLVGASLAKAREAGVVTVSVADVPAASTADAYDAYVSYRMPLMHQINAYHLIAETDGAANVILVNDSAFPNLVESNNQFQKVMAECNGCSVEVVDWQITDALDPVKADTVITAALQGNPDATHIVVPYSIGMSSVIEAVRKAGKADQVSVVSKDGDQIGLQAVASGGSSANAGVSLEWVAYAGVDQAVRGVAGEPYLGPEDLGLGVHMFTPENTPADGLADYSSMIDYKAEYLKLWGVG